MELSELDGEERLALVALVERVVLADHNVSSDEEGMLPEIVEAFGQEGYRQAALAADDRLRDDDTFKTFLQGLKREDARELIYGTVMELAMSDVISGNESPLLEWLSATWKLETKIEDTLPED